MESKQFLKQIAIEGTPEEKKALFQFDSDTPNEKVLKKFKYFARSCYPHYFTHNSAPFHDEMVLNYIQSYRGVQNGIEIAFRGAAKTSYLKLFVSFVILNDQSHTRRFLKVLSRDLKNATSFVTDVYNNIVFVTDIYGDVFEKEGDIKREERMGSFTTKDKVKLMAGTVGQAQRGHLQDAYRPDWVLFEDIEDRESISSIIMTEGIIRRCDEAITGLSFEGNFHVNANYISDAGVVQWFLDKPSILKHIVPIINKNGEPLWDRYTPEKLENEKAKTDDWAGEYLCLKPDTLVTTSKGKRPIKDIEANELVVTHRGEIKKVLKKFEREADEMLDITAGGKTITITPNHPVLTIRNGVEDWIPAGELTTEDFVVVIPHDKL